MDPVPETCLYYCFSKCHDRQSVQSKWFQIWYLALYLYKKKIVYSGTVSAVFQNCISKQGTGGQILNTSINKCSIKVPPSPQCKHSTGNSHADAFLYTVARITNAKHRKHITLNNRCSTPKQDRIKYQYAHTLYILSHYKWLLCRTQNK